MIIIELKIDKKELDCFNDIKKIIYSLPKVTENENTFLKLKCVGGKEKEI